MEWEECCDDDDDDNDGGDMTEVMSSSRSRPNPGRFNSTATPKRVAIRFMTVQYNVKSSAHCCAGACCCFDDSSLLLSSSLLLLLTPFGWSCTGQAMA